MTPTVSTGKDGMMVFKSARGSGRLLLERWIEIIVDAPIASDVLTVIKQVNGAYLKPEKNTMALVKCEECGNIVSTKAMACPKCGAVFPRTCVESQATLGRNSKSEVVTNPKGSGQYGCTTLIAILAIAGFVFYGVDYLTDPFRNRPSPTPVASPGELAKQRDHEACQQVLSLVNEAESLWKSGDSEAANKKLELADSQHASNKLPIAELRTKMGNAKIAPLMAEATKALTAGNIDLAKAKIHEALSVPNATAIAEVTKLDQLIKDMTDPSHIRTILVDLSGDELVAFEQKGILPQSMKTGFDGLDAVGKKLAVAQIADVSPAREARRQEEKKKKAERIAVWQEEQKKEAERLAAWQDEQKKEAERIRAWLKKDAERLAASQAEEDARQKPTRDRQATFKREIDATGTKLVSNVVVTRIGDSWVATIIVNNFWHIRHKQIRLQDAQVLEKMWQRIADPQNLNHANIRIVDWQDNEVGGTGLLGTWVQD